jgi:hypothetical protein
MPNTAYRLNKGVNATVEFRGLQAQYIIYLGLGLLGMLMVFMMLFIAGINGWCCLILVFGSGAALFFKVYQLNRRYGRFGLMKKRAARKLPHVIRAGSRHMFYGRNMK